MTATARRCRTACWKFGRRMRRGILPIRRTRARFRTPNFVASGVAAPIGVFGTRRAVAGLVRWFWIPEWQIAPGRSSRQHLIAFPACNLVVEPDMVGLAGPTTRSSYRDLTGTGWAVGALLRPAAVPSFAEDPEALRDSYQPRELAALHERVSRVMNGSFDRATRHGLVVEVRDVNAASWCSFADASADVREPVGARWRIPRWAAATLTWWLNRRYTFAPTEMRAAEQWLRFLAVNMVGAVVNYAVFALVLSTVAVAMHYPLIAVAAGALAGLVFNFLLSQKFAFVQASRNIGMTSRHSS